MSTLQKAVIGAALAVVVGTGVYLASQASRHELRDQGTHLRADIDKEIPLARAIEEANAKFPDVQPLTQEEVIAAVRAMKSKYKNLPDSVYNIYQRVVNERVLPKGMYFTHTSAWRTQYGDFEVDWKELTLDCDRAGIRGGKSGAIFNCRVRARFISLMGAGTPVASRSAHPRAEVETPKREQGAYMRADIDKDIPVAQAIKRANARFPDPQPLTEAEVVAAVSAIKLKYPDLPDSIYEVYQRVVNERILPRGMFFSRISGWQTPYEYFDVDWKDLTLDAKHAGIDGGNLGFNYRIRARFISSRPLTNAEKQALRRNRDGRFVLHTEAGAPAQ